MTFHPEALDLDQIKRLAKTMKQKSPEVVTGGLTLSKSQELLARALGYDNWHALQTPRNPAKATKVEPEPRVGGRCERPWNSVDDLTIYERILLGAFVATSEGDQESAGRALASLAQFDGNLDAFGLDKPHGGHLDRYPDQIADGLRLTHKFPGHPLTRQPDGGDGSVKAVLVAALGAARTRGEIKPEWIRFLKREDHSLWEALMGVSGDPFHEIRELMELLNDMLMLVEQQAPLLNALNLISDVYRLHGKHYQSDTIKNDWIPEAIETKDWKTFLEQRLKKYHKSLAIKVGLSVRGPSASLSDTLIAAIKELRRVGDEDDRRRLFGNSRSN